MMILCLGIGNLFQIILSQVTDCCFPYNFDGIRFHKTKFSVNKSTSFILSPNNPPPIPACPWVRLIIWLVCTLQIYLIDSFDPYNILFHSNSPNIVAQTCNVPNNDVSKSKPPCRLLCAHLIPSYYSSIITKVLTIPKKCSTYLINFSEHAFGKYEYLNPLNMKTK